MPVKTMAAPAALAAAMTSSSRIEPPGLAPSMHAVRSAAFVLDADSGFAEARPDAFVAVAGVSHTSI